MSADTATRLAREKLALLQELAKQREAAADTIARLTREKSWRQHSVPQRDEARAELGAICVGATVRPLEDR